MIAIQPLFIHVIAPMFNKFTPLEEGELKTAIEEFANKVSFPIGRIDIMDGSKGLLTLMHISVDLENQGG